MFQAAHEQSPAARDALVKQVDVHDLRLLELEKTSYNGSLIWKVEGFEKLLQDAKADKKVCYYVVDEEFRECLVHRETKQTISKMA